MGRTSFSVVRCVNCGLGETQPVPEDLSLFYKNYYGGRHGLTARYRARRRLARVSRYAKGNNLLDIGYGEGTFLDLAVNKGYKCVGVERFAAKNNRSFEAFDKLESVSEAHPLQKFDNVTCWHSLEHIAEPDAVLDSISEMLSKDGSLFIAVPNFAGRQAQMFGKNWLHLDVPRHLLHFSPNSLEKMLGNHGFHISDTWHHESEYDIMGWSQSILNALFKERNVFFHTLTGKSTDAGAFAKILHFLAGTLFSAAALPLVLFDIATKRGGTIVIRANFLILLCVAANTARTIAGRVCINPLSLNFCYEKQQRRDS